MSKARLDGRTDGPQRATDTPPGVPERDDPSVDPDELLALLSDDHARTILRTIGEEGLPARTVAERLDLSRATVYRRLNRLESAGAVRTTMAVHAEGHHRKHYHATLDEVTLSFDGGDVAVEATV
jgi:DNA-binding transcriptional ArsR family regulator